MQIDWEKITMKYCHKCNTEYIIDIETCPDCGSVLHDAPGLEETVSTDEKDWVIVTRVKDQYEAEMIHSLLESEGIHTSVRDPAGGLKNLYGPFLPDRGTVEILVHKSNLEKAREVILKNSEWTEDELTEYMESEGSIGGDAENDDDLDS
jgi:hypothetical protein